MKKIRLGDVCEILNGFAFKSENYVNSGIRIIRIANVQKGYIEDNTPVFYPLDYYVLEKYMLKEDDLLVSLTGNVGRVAILDKEFLPAALNQRVACLRLKTNKISKGFLFHILNSDYFEQKCIQSSKGVAQKNMSTEWLKDYEILLYSEKEQAKITTVLDKIRSVIDKRKVELQKLDELVKARFVEMFANKGYPQVEVGKLLIQNTTVEKIQNTKMEKFVTIGVRGSGARQRAIKDGKWPVPFSGYRVKSGQFIYSRIDARNGAFAILSDDLHDAVVSKDFPVFNIDTKQILPNVFLHSVLEDRFVKQIQNNSFGATNRQRIQEEVFAKYTISLAPLDVQKEYEAFCNQIDKSKVAVEAQLLFDILVQKYFG